MIEEEGEVTYSVLHNLSENSSSQQQQQQQQTGPHRRRSSGTNASISSAQLSFNNPVYGRCLRRALLSRITDKQNCRDYLKTTYFMSPGADTQAQLTSLAITGIQFKTMLKSLEVMKYIEDGEDSENSSPVKFNNAFIKDMKLANENQITYDELCSYLWKRSSPSSPSPSSPRPIGTIIEITKRAIIESIGEKLISRSRKSKKDDLFLTEAFAKKTGIQLVRGSLLSARHLKKSLPRFLNAYLGEELPNETVDQLIQSLDSNSDGVVSSREFKAWLFSSSDSPVPMEEIGRGFDDGDETETETESMKQPVADTPVDYVESDPLQGDDNNDNNDDDNDNGNGQFDDLMGTGYTTPEGEGFNTTPPPSEHNGGVGMVGEISDRHGQEEKHQPSKTAPNDQQSSCCQCMLGTWGFKLIYEPVGE